MAGFKVSDDAEHMAQAAREALTRPSDCAMWDDRLYTTHGPVISWADRGDDILSESNYHAALAMLNGAVAHDETGASEARGDDVIDASVSHWLVGSLRQIFVRVYIDPDTDELEYTPAFREAVEMAAALESYPVLDESDYSEREYEAWQSTVDDAIDQAERDYPDDSEAERCLLYWLLTDRGHDELPDLVSHGGMSPDEVDYDATAKAYAALRNEHFEWLAARFTVPEWPYPLPGAVRLPGM